MSLYIERSPVIRFDELMEYYKEGKKYDERTYNRLIEYYGDRKSTANNVIHVNIEDSLFTENSTIEYELLRWLIMGLVEELKDDEWCVVQF